MLVYSDTEWSAGVASRFNVQLTRTADHESRRRGGLEVDRRALSALVVGDFGVDILPSIDYWWSYRDTDSLARALAEAGHLIVGYGMPWLAGELSPPQTGGRNRLA